MYKVMVLIHKTDTGFCAYAPEVPGCVATGQTMEQTEERMHEALEMHIEDMLAQGEEIPEQNCVSSAFFMVRIPVESSNAA